MSLLIFLFGFLKLLNLLVVRSVIHVILVELDLTLLLLLKFWLQTILLLMLNLRVRLIGNKLCAEYESLLRNKTWSLVPLPLGNNLVCCKWVYKTNFTTQGQIWKYKARLVIKGFNQLEGIDYNETFLLLLKWTQ